MGDGHAPCSEYHPSAEWLKSHGLTPDKAKSVEIENASKCIGSSVDQPSMVLHELAHAYHDRVLGFDDSGILAAYRNAVEGHRHDLVRHKSGKLERADALANAQEYFAEGTEAYFRRNDFFPFNRAELKHHDPELLAHLIRVSGEGAEGPSLRCRLPGRILGHQIGDEIAHPGRPNGRRQPHGHDRGRRRADLVDFVTAQDGAPGISVGHAD